VGAAPDGKDRLDISVDGPSYYMLSRLESSDALRVDVLLDGEPLSDDVLAVSSLTVETEGGEPLTCAVEPLAGESAFQVRILGDENAQPGKYTLKFDVTTQDETGRELSSDQTYKVQLSKYPIWIRLVILLLILAVIIALVLIYLNTKVLPKRIAASQSAFIVEGDEISGTTGCKYSGGGGKNGNLQVATPFYTGSALVKGGFSLTLQAVSPRKIKSPRRRIHVVKLSATNPSALVNLQVGTHILTRMDDGDGVVWLFDGKQVPGPNVTTDFTLAGKTQCTYIGETLDGKDFTHNVVLQFK
jgi:hypothetical protein